MRLLIAIAALALLCVSTANAQRECGAGPCGYGHKTYENQFTPGAGFTVIRPVPQQQRVVRKKKAPATR
jgi:hypothetical protein